MTQQTESCVPPGFRFHPTDEELVGYYLRKKVASKKIDLDVIKDIDLYRIEPWDLKDKCRIGYEEEKEWYFFSHKDKKYPTGTRTNRATIAGFWKATGRDKAVYDVRSKVIGMRKTLVFYKGRAPNGQKTEWIMHEYRLESQENSPLQEEGWVVCRAFRKRPTGHAKTTEPWDASNFYDESTTINSLLNPTDSTTRHHHQNFLPQSFLCKQEYSTESDHHNLMMNNFIHSDSFAHLPPLASPSLPAPPPSENKKVTDWRSLDKFVASQLSHVDDHGGSDLGCVLLQNGRDEFWSSFTDRDLGISLYSDKSTI